MLIPSLLGTIFAGSAMNRCAGGAVPLCVSLIQSTPGSPFISAYGQIQSNMTSSTSDNKPPAQYDNQTQAIPSQQQFNSSEPIAHNQLTPTKFSLYENSTYRVHILYPSKWEVLEGDRNRYNGALGVVRFISPFENSTDRYRETVRFSVDLLPPGNTTLNQYSLELVGYKNETLDNFDLIDQNDDSNILAGNLAYRLIYNHTINDGKTTIREMEIGTKVRDKVYYLNYSAEEDRFRSLLPTIQEMVSSFRIG